MNEGAIDTRDGAPALLRHGAELLSHAPEPGLVRYPSCPSLRIAAGRRNDGRLCCHCLCRLTCTMLQWTEPLTISLAVVSGSRSPISPATSLPYPRLVK